MSGYLTTVVVRGVPVPQGSMRAFAGRVVAGNAGRLERWRGDIRSAFRPSYVGPSVPFATEAFAVALDFIFARPSSHLNAKGEVKPKFGDRRPRGDIDKLTRAVLDALTNIVWKDDDQVVAIEARKRWSRMSGDEPGLVITIALEDNP